MSRGPIDMRGRRFGSLVAAAPAGTSRQGTLWLCRCDCGRDHVAPGPQLRYGNVRQCPDCARAGVVDSRGRMHRTGRMREIDPTPCPTCGFRGGCHHEERSIWQSGGLIHHHARRSP